MHEGSRDAPRPVIVIHRCPYCHGDLSVQDDDWVACRGCLARHHTSCWDEAGRCATCADPRTLSALHVRPAPARSKPGRHPLVAAFGWPARVVVALLTAANRWPRLTGVLAVLLTALLVSSGPRVRRQVVYVDRPVERTVHVDRPEVSPPQQLPLTRAYALANEGEFTKARLTLERAIQADPSQAGLHEALGWMCLCDGLPEQAARAYAVARARQPGQGRFTWGEVLTRTALGDRQGALEALGPSLIVSSPVYPDLWRALLLDDAGGLAVHAQADTWQGALSRWARGELSDAALLDLAAGPTLSRLTPEQRLCEAHAYLALRADLRGDRAAALEGYTRAQATAVFNYIEYAFAAARVRALEGGGPTLDALAPR